MKVKLKYGSDNDSNVGRVCETYSATGLSIDARPLTAREKYAAENGGNDQLSGNLTEGDVAMLIVALETLDWVQWVKTQMAAETPAGEPGGEVAQYARRYAPHDHNDHRAAVALAARQYAERHPGCSYEQALDELKFAQPTA